MTVKLPKVDHAAIVAMAFAAGDPNPGPQVRAALDDYFLTHTRDPDGLQRDIDAARLREQEARDHVLSAVDPRVHADPDTMEVPPLRKQESGADRENLTIRLDAGYLNRCAAFALIYDNSIAEQVRTAIDRYLQYRVGDAAARAVLVAEHERHRESLAATIDERPVSATNSQRAG